MSKINLRRTFNLYKYSDALSKFKQVGTARTSVDLLTSISIYNVFIDDEFYGEVVLLKEGDVHSITIYIKNNDINVACLALEELTRRPEAGKRWKKLVLMLPYTCTYIKDKIINMGYKIHSNNDKQQFYVLVNELK